MLNIKSIKFAAMLINADVNNPPVAGESYAERWAGPDGGLIVSWLNGLEKRNDSAWSAIVQAAQRGELPVLPWKGGVEKTLKGKKPGVYQYLAMWQGLRGESLHIDTDAIMEFTCTKYQTRVVFSPDAAMLDECQS